MLEVKLPHVCENKNDFDLVAKIICGDNKKVNKPDLYPCAIIDYFNYIKGDLDCEFIFLYPNDLKEIIKNSKFADIINGSI